jgi:insertion element IS1 protein InsB
MDEFRSFVKRKSNRRWTWYAMDKSSSIILAWHNGNRTDADFQKLLGYFENIPVDLYYTDDCGAYKGILPEYKHRIGKDRTWKIERKNLNLRTHIKRLNRKTVCYSKSEEIHDNVAGMYIERFYFKSGLYRNSA